MAKGTLTIEAAAHSNGNVRCAVKSVQASTWATFHHADQSPLGSGTLTIFLSTVEEIAAFRALSEALAAQDVVEGVEA